MAATNINRVILTGNLTRNPELRSLPSGMSVCSLRIAVNTRRKDSSSGEWADKPNYFAITVWGAQGENCARFLAKGRPIAVDGRLEWREWTDKENNKRATVDIIADSIQFLGPRDSTNDGNAASADTNPNGPDAPPPTDVPVDTSDLQPAAPGGNVEDDIPFWPLARREP
jgi:single-strand DNA-binding protein